MNLLRSSILKTLKGFLIFFVILIVYLTTSVPVGLFLYSLKSNAGINVFSKTGFHSYMHCLREETYKVQIQKAQEDRVK